MQVTKHKRNSQVLKVVAMDPSMSNWGIAVAYVHLNDMTVEFGELAVIKPNKTKLKSQRVNAKDVEIAKELLSGIEPFLEDADIILAEVPVGSQSSRAMVSYAMCVSIIGFISLYYTEVFHVSPSEVKLNVQKDATKDQMIQWAIRMHPEAAWKRKTIKGVTTVIKGHAEHVSDAIGAFYAATRKPTFKKLIHSFIGNP